MPTSLNEVKLIGHVGKDPEIRSFQNGGRVAGLTLATSKKWKDRTTGELKELTEWHRISIFNEQIVKVCEKYVTKGMRLYVQGSLETRKWTDKENVERYSTEVVLRPYNGSLIMLSSKDGKPVEGSDDAEDMPVDMGEPLPA
jgi:single-strand DNA-binding protein